MLVGKDVLWGVEKRNVLLSHGGQVPTDAQKRIGSLVTAGTPRHLVVNFGQTKIFLRAIVGKWHVEVVNEAEHVVGVTLQAVE